MKLLHTSDWHLGMIFKSGITYKDDQKQFISEICQIAQNEKVDGILMAGDMFDKSIASNEAIDLFDETMTDICLKLNIPVYMIAGNHDGAKRIASCSSLLKKSGLYICGALEEKVEKISIDDVDIYLLPWISTDKVRLVFPDKAEEINSMEDAYRVVLDNIRSQFVKGQKNILVAHAFIVNAETSVSDRAAVVGNATMVSASCFEGFDYVALGHIHGPQQINSNIRYCGSPMPYSFGNEEKQTKSVTIIDTDTMEQKVIPINNLHKRTTLSGTFEELKKADFPKEIVDGYVRLEVTDIYVGLEGISILREKYKNLLEISSKSLDSETTSITMSIDEFENELTSPKDVFERYCEDILNEKASEHFKELFSNALAIVESEVG